MSSARRTISAVAIPRPGLGDILYHFLWLEVLCRNHQIRHGYLVIPAPAEQLLPEHPFIARSTGITWLSRGNFKWGIRGELRFWRAVFETRCSVLVGINHDFVERLFGALVGKMAGAAAIGDYLRVHSIGRRSRVSALMPRIGKTRPNPRHFVRRMELVTAAEFDLGPEQFSTQLRAAFARCFPDTVASARSTDTVLICPEAGRIERSLSPSEAAQFARAIGRQAKVVVLCTSKAAPNYTDSLRAHGVEVRTFSTIKATADAMRSASVVVTCDSFPAHLGGLVGATSIVVYKAPLLRNYCEYWGSPFDCVFHVERGSLLRLDQEYQCVQLQSSDQPLLVDICARVAIDLTLPSRDSSRG